MDKDDKKLLKTAAESIESVRAISSATNALTSSPSLSTTRLLHLLLSAGGLVGDAMSQAKRHLTPLPKDYRHLN